MKKLLVMFVLIIAACASKHLVGEPTVNGYYWSDANIEAGR